MMPLQRACDAENQARNKLSNGPLRAQSKGGISLVFCDVGGRRYLPGICWYLAKLHGNHEFKVAPRIVLYMLPSIRP